jgi:diguanylate cyclase (GGDEF)-like protein
MLFALMEWTGMLPIPVALAAVATLGYLIGRRRANAAADSAELQGRRDLKRAQQVAQELERIADEVRQHLAAHHASIVHFKERVFGQAPHGEPSWHELRREAENMLRPTLKLAAELASAYDEIRQQSGYLLSFGELRTDPLTRVGNRRALDEYLATHLARMERYQAPFAVAVVDIDQFKRINDDRGHAYGDSLLESVARVLADSVRETDIVSRYGGEEFVVVMPHTMLEGAALFANRLRERVELSLPLTVSAGVSSAVDGDNIDSLLARADAALYAAKAAGRNRVFMHNGVQIRAGQVDGASGSHPVWTAEQQQAAADREQQHELVGNP